MVVYETVERLNTRNILILAAAVWCVRVFVAFEYGLHYSGSATTDRIEALPYWVSIATSLTSTLGPLLPVWAYAMFRLKPLSISKLILLSLVAGELLNAFMAGRREMIFLVALLGLLEWSLGTRRSFRPVLLGVLAIAFLSVALPRFEKARYVASTSMDPGSRDLVEFVEATVDPHAYGAARFESRVANRSAIYVEWAAEVLEAQGSRPLLRGTALRNGLAFSIPSAILPEKGDWRRAELLINEDLEINRGDSPNSVAMVGLADFGPAGLLLYALGFGMVLIFGERLATRLRRRWPFVSLLILLATLQAAVLSEQTIISLAVQARNILLISALFAAAHIVRPGSKLATRRHER